MGILTSRDVDVEPYFDGCQGDKKGGTGGVLANAPDEGPIFDGCRRERGGAGRRRTIVRRGLRDNEATEGGAKSGPSSREDFAWIEYVIRVEQLLDLFHRQHRLIRQLHAEIGCFGQAYTVLTGKRAAETNGL